VIASFPGSVPVLWGDQLLGAPAAFGRKRLKKRREPFAGTLAEAGYGAEQFGEAVKSAVLPAAPSPQAFATKRYKQAA
jgi:hypothetical protein